MPSSKDIQRQLQNEIKLWASELSDNLTKSLIEALKKGGRKNQNATNLRFNYDVSLNKGLLNLIIYAKTKNGRSADYWSVIEDGRKKGTHVPNVVENLGKDWQVGAGIDPRVFLLNYKNKKNGNPLRKFKKLKKTLDINNSYKTVSYIIARGIYSNGIKPKPYLSSVINKNATNELRNIISEKYGMIITAEIQELSNKYKTFKP